MSTYVPAAGKDWENVSLEKTGFSEQGVEQIIVYAKDNESVMGRDIGAVLGQGHFDEPPPDGDIIGPTEMRSDPSGMVLKEGRIVAEWGPTDATDMTFSVTKSFLSLCAGLAVDDGLIPDINAPVRELVSEGQFDSEQNRTITWAHLLTQTSEWEGTLWSKADRIDRHRQLDGTGGDGARKGSHRDLKAPGAFWEYNDIRVNVMAYALLQIFKKPLPEILQSRIMNPIGASDKWRWHGYENSWVEIDGQKMQSVSGGAHWGGGMFISSKDQARLGLLMCRNGRWGDQQLISQDWIKRCCTPCKINPSYGLLWWLNTDRTYCPAAPESSYFALGHGQNIIWIDPELDLVVVTRWIEKAAFNGFAERIMRGMS